MIRSFTRQQEEKRREQRKRSMPWREYWHLYLSLVGTGILTAFAGVYLGLAPSANGQIVFLSEWDAVRRVFFALYYAGSFLLVAEGATLFAKDKLLQRDVEEDAGKMVDIPAQRTSMTAMLWVSVLAIVATTVAAGYILAAWLGALSEFVTIPTAAQTWVVIGPPALLVFDAVMALIYQQSSKQSELDRWIQQQKRMAEADSQEQWAKEYVTQYRSVAPEAARKAARAAAMTDARKWSGTAVDDVADEPKAVMETPKRLLTPTHYEEELAKLPKSETHDLMLGEWAGPGKNGEPRTFQGFINTPPDKPHAGDVVIEETHDPRMGAHVVTEEEAKVMEENSMTPAPEPPAEPAPDQEVGTDQSSPT